jgi:hypothetical protein
MYHRLPLELIHYIYSYLPFIDIALNRSVSRRIQQVNCEESLQMMHGYESIYHIKLSPIVFRNYDIGVRTKQIVISHLMFELPKKMDCRGLQTLYLYCEFLIELQMENINTILEQCENLEFYKIYTASRKYGISSILLNSALQCKKIKTIIIDRPNNLKPFSIQDIPMEKRNITVIFKNSKIPE